MKLAFVLSLILVVIATSIAYGLCPYIPGDINGNGSANGIDVVWAVNYFKGGPPPPVRCDMCPQPPPFYAAGDINGDCVFNGIDIVLLINCFRFYIDPDPVLAYCPTCPPDSM